MATAASSAPSPAVLFERMATRLRMRHLRLIVALVTHATLRRAAESLHVSQPAATQMLREIENLLDVRLFERHARGMLATDAGRRLAAQARTMLDALHVAADELHASAVAGERPLRIGAIPAALVSLLRPGLPALQRASGLRLHIAEANIEQLLAGFASGAYDMVLLRQPARLAAGQRFVLLRRDRVVIAANPRHTAAQRSRVRLADLAGSRWLLPPETFAVRQVIDAALQRAKIVPIEHHLQSASPLLLGQLLADADVVAPAPRSMLDGVPAGLAVELKLALHAPLEPLGALYRSDSPRMAALRHLIELLEAGSRAVGRARR
jgi:DNA-binding transcriptional LysR family regulator